MVNFALVVAWVTGPELADGVDAGIGADAGCNPVPPPHPASDKIDIIRSARRMRCTLIESAGSRS